jgi:hypothetical protein
VIWPTGALPPTFDTAAEWVYTICTRTTGLLIIILENTANVSTRRVVARFDRSRLLFWTEEAREVFDTWCHSAD